MTKQTSFQRSIDNASLHSSVAATSAIAFCDYDDDGRMSTTGRESIISNIDKHLEDDADKKEKFINDIIRDTRWYDKSSGAYFTSPQTRNAQTVSWKQRHRPVFQIFNELILGMFFTAWFLFTATIYIKDVI